MVDKQLSTSPLILSYFIHIFESLYHLYIMVLQNGKSSIWVVFSRSELLVLLQTWTALLEELGPQEQILVPGGWRGSSTNWVFELQEALGTGRLTLKTKKKQRNVGKRRSSPNRNDMLTMCVYHGFVVQRLQRSSYPNIFRQSRFKAQVVFLVERDLMPMLAVSALPPGMNSLEPEATKISFIPPKRFSNIWHLII